MGFGVQLLQGGRTKISVPILPVPKPALSMMLRTKKREPLKRNQSEAGIWLHPRVPNTLVHYLLEKQLRKDGKQRLNRRLPMRPNRSKGLPPLKAMQSREVLHRSKSSVR